MWRTGCYSVWHNPTSCPAQADSLRSTVSLVSPAAASAAPKQLKSVLSTPPPPPPAASVKSSRGTAQSLYFDRTLQYFELLQLSPAAVQTFRRQHRALFSAEEYDVLLATLAERNGNAS